MIEITSVAGQTYYTIDLSKVDIGICDSFKNSIKDYVNSRFYCVYSLGEIMLINCAIFDGLINSGILDSYRRFIDKKQ